MFLLGHPEDRGRGRKSLIQAIDYVIGSEDWILLEDRDMGGRATHLHYDKTRTHVTVRAVFNGRTRYERVYLHYAWDNRNHWTARDD